ncbi:hypothetical protein [Paraburkholderia susongensis]|uniref:Uncharacterized protein n=1 Tax=Paraburkholderia susongensis TaxID=1515439 RepID=A0A1X7ICD2_9BURK|nr:hypothetical protein [Paraburkholderia susongensis]SMG12304.1 hypothetical protein SAMN06265784_101555 [Paraburkholderia susongensis]
MKPRVVNTICSARPWPPRGFSPSVRTFAHHVAMLGGGAAVALALSGCYYPAGYYPSGYYTSYYATPPAATTQQSATADPSNPSDAQQAQAQAQAQAAPQNPPPGYVVAAPPPAYVAPYPAYYPPPVYPYPAYYGYPGYYGPSVSIGFGGYWGGGWGRHWR